MSKPIGYRVGYLLFLTLAITPLLLGQEFRIDTELYLDDSSKSSSRNMTLFSDAVVYDFLMSDSPTPEPIQITIFNRSEKKFILIDMQRKVRCELERTQLIKLLEAMRKEAMQNETVRFMADIQFKEDYDITSEAVEARSDLIRYELKGSHPSDSTILPAYHDFLDHYTMLGATDPQRFPPFARMKFNQIIKKYGWVPQTITFSVGTNEVFQRPMKAKTEHILNMNLSDRDRERIELAKRCWMNYQMVNLSDYRGLPELVKDESESTTKK
ncbi:MAG: hypothetical protein MK108_13245 [Mariniblastus sp.]|nr:hypothetical protein [Mariniblastus sp.]